MVLRKFTKFKMKRDQRQRSPVSSVLNLFDNCRYVQRRRARRRENKDPSHNQKQHAYGKREKETS